MAATITDGTVDFGLAETVLQDMGEILPDHLGLGEDEGPWSTPDMEELSYEAGKQEALEAFQRRFIERALTKTGGNVTHAADKCGLTRAALQRIMRSLHLDRNQFVP